VILGFFLFQKGKKRKQDNVEVIKERKRKLKESEKSRGH
jgi:hypothetical protein